MGSCMIMFLYDSVSDNLLLLLLFIPAVRLWHASRHFLEIGRQRAVLDKWAGAPDTQLCIPLKSVFHNFLKHLGNIFNILVPFKM